MIHSKHSELYLKIQVLRSFHLPCETIRTKRLWKNISQIRFSLHRSILSSKASIRRFYENPMKTSNISEESKRFVFDFGPPACVHACCIHHNLYINLLIFLSSYVSKIESE